MGVYINSNLLPIQPSTIQEEPLQAQTDVVSLDYSVQRNYVGQKWQAVCTFENLSVAAYQQLSSYILNGQTCTYYNDMTAESTAPLTFTALATWSKQPYVRGASLMQPVSVTFRQV